LAALEVEVEKGSGVDGNERESEGGDGTGSWKP